MRNSDDDIYLQINWLDSDDDLTDPVVNILIDLVERDWKDLNTGPGNGGAILEIKQPYRQNSFDAAQLALLVAGKNDPKMKEVLTHDLNFTY